MRKVKSYCKGCFKPKKMEFRKKDAFVSSPSDQRATLINALSKIKLEQNKLAQAVKKHPVKKPSETHSFSTLQITQRKQAFTLH